MRAVLPMILLAACAESIEVEPLETSLEPAPCTAFWAVAGEWNRLAPEPLPARCYELDGAPPVSCEAPEDTIHAWLHTLSWCAYGDMDRDHLRALWHHFQPEPLEERAEAALAACQASEAW